MGEFFAVLNKCFQFLKIPMQIYEFNFSFWDLYLFMILSTVILSFVAAVIMAASGSSAKAPKKGK